MAEENHKASFTSGEKDGNARRDDRFKVETQVQYRVINRQVVEELGGSGGFRDDGESVNISRSGIALATETLLNKGDYIKLEMKLPTSDRTTRALAEVMWSRKEQDKNVSGIRFMIILNEADGHSVSEFIDTIRDSEKG